MAEKFLVSFLQDHYRRIIDRWIDRLSEHSESRYDRLSPPKLETICERGLGASFSYLKGYKDPSLKDLVRKLLREKDQWDLETFDILRFFWGFRSVVIEVADMGGDAGTRDWKSLHDQLDSVVETAIIHVIETVEDK